MVKMSKTPLYAPYFSVEFLSMLRNCSSLLRTEALQNASRAISDIP
ncbi:MAG TPA: hypothetical protein VI894_02555 [Candidatus Nanoarchaeia archaeon]|nr:hypothetical protein [Candidatus Nanoarchaeia archaeon]